jgi:hypothetical protein
MRPADAEPDHLPIISVEELIEYPFEPNEDIAFIDEWWIQLKSVIPDMLPIIQREVFQKQLNLTNIEIDFEWTSGAIAQNAHYADHIIDLDDEYDMCCRMYLTKMLVAYNDVESDNYTDFVASVNDFIQHECDNM